MDIKLADARGRHLVAFTKSKSKSKREAGKALGTDTAVIERSLAGC
jgi:hypothetical protein